MYSVDRGTSRGRLTTPHFVTQVNQAEPYLAVFSVERLHPWSTEYTANRDFQILFLLEFNLNWGPIDLPFGPLLLDKT